MKLSARFLEQCVWVDPLDTRPGFLSLMLHSPISLSRLHHSIQSFFYPNVVRSGLDSGRFHTIAHAIADHQSLQWIGKSGKRGMLANHPAEFAMSGEVCERQLDISTTPFSITNLGLRIELPLVPHPLPNFGETYIAVLHCGSSASSPPLGIYVERDDWAKDQFTRVEPHAIVRGVDNWRTQNIEVLFVQDRHPEPVLLGRKEFLKRREEQVHHFSFLRVLLQGHNFSYEESLRSGNQSFCQVGKERVDVMIKSYRRHESYSGWSLTGHRFANENQEWFMVILGAKEKDIMVNILTPANTHEVESTTFWEDILRLHGKSPVPNDRIFKQLLGHRTVSVVVTEALLSGKIVRDVRISVKPSAVTEPVRVKDVVSLRQTRDVFVVRRDRALRKLFPLQDFIPEKCWKRRENGSVVLTSTSPDDAFGSLRLDLSGVLGYKGYAIVLGIRNSQAWADVIMSLEDSERIRASYSRNGERESVPALYFTRIVEPLHMDLSLKVEITKIRHVGEDGFQTRISLVDGAIRERFSESLTLDT